MLTDARKSVKRRGRHGAKSSSYVVCGFHPVAVLLETRPEAVERLLCTRETRGEVLENAGETSARIELCETRDLVGLVGDAAHQGVVAVARPRLTQYGSGYTHSAHNSSFFRNVAATGKYRDSYIDV